MIGELETMQENIIVKSRFDKGLYAIKSTDYNKILDLINFYHESIYNLPDEEQVFAQPIMSEDGPGRHKQLKVNELVFI